MTFLSSLLFNLLQPFWSNSRPFPNLPLIILTVTYSRKYSVATWYTIYTNLTWLFFNHSQLFLFTSCLYLPILLVPLATRFIYCLSLHSLCTWPSFCLFSTLRVNGLLCYTTISLKGLPFTWFSELRLKDLCHNHLSVQWSKNPSKVTLCCICSVLALFINRWLSLRRLCLPAFARCMQVSSIHTAWTTTTFFPQLPRCLLFYTLFWCLPVRCLSG